MRRYIPILSAFLIFITLGNLSADIMLRVDPAMLCIGMKDYLITFSMNNPFDKVAALQVDILFDTDCFTVTAVNKSDRSADMDIFNSSDIDCGIRIAMAGISHYISRGTGPIAEIIVEIEYVNYLVCDCLWDVTGSVAANHYGGEIHVKEVDGCISLAYCDPLLEVSSTEFDLGDVWIGQAGVETLTVFNVGSVGCDVYIISEGCAGAAPTIFLLESGSSQEVIVFCRPEEGGPCEGWLTLQGCMEDVDVAVTCNGVIPDSAVLSISDRVVFKNSRGNRLTLDLENIVPIAALQTDILFDTTCFEVVSAERMGRNPIDIFNWARIDGGIRIVNVGAGEEIPEGAGPIAEILVDVGACPEGDCLWDVTNAIVADPLGRIITAKEVDGTVSIFSGLKGDINDDGVINALDVVLGVRIITDQFPNPSPRELEAADCNSDGEIGVTDILGIVNLITGLGTCLP